MEMAVNDNNDDHKHEWHDSPSSNVDTKSISTLSTFPTINDVTYPAFPSPIATFTTAATKTTSEMETYAPLSMSLNPQICWSTSAPPPTITESPPTVVFKVVAIMVVVIIFNWGLSWDIVGPYPMEPMMSEIGKQKRQPCLYTYSSQSWSHLLKNHPPSALSMHLCNSFRHPLHPKKFSCAFLMEDIEFKNN